MSDGGDAVGESFERRALMKHLSDSLEGVHKELKDLGRSVNYYRATQEEAIEKAIDKAMLRAFPEGDVEGHRRAHEAAIKAAEDRASMYKDIRISVAKWGVMGLLSWGVFHLWNAFLIGPGK